MKVGQGQGFTLLELMITLFIISILAMVAVPMYRDYITRTEIMEDLEDTVKMIRLNMAEHYMINGSLPTTNEHMGLGKDKTIKGVRLEKVKIDGNPMPGTIKVHFDRKGAFPMLGKQNRIEYVPTPVNGRLVWDCKGGNMLDVYRPQNCRGDSKYGN